MDQLQTGGGQLPISSIRFMRASLRCSVIGENSCPESLDPTR
jgi:hypothetical protein